MMKNRIQTSVISTTYEHYELHSEISLQHCTKQNYDAILRAKKQKQININAKKIVSHACYNLTHHSRLLFPPPLLLLRVVVPLLLQMIVHHLRQKSHLRPCRNNNYNSKN